MTYPGDWRATHENGVRILTSTDDPLHGASSLLLYSDGSEFDATDTGFRKSASLYLNATRHERGFSDGRLRTLIQRNNATLQSHAWGGIYILSERAGIGTRSDPGESRYEISDQDGFIQLVKFTDALPEVLEVSTHTFESNIPYGFQVRWLYSGLADNLFIEVFLGTSLTFTDLVPIIAYTDADNPHHIAETEGLFVQTLATDDVVSYSFDVTSVYISSQL